MLKITQPGKEKKFLTSEQKANVIDYVSPDSSYVDTLIPNGMVFGDRLFGR